MKIVKTTLEVQVPDSFRPDNMLSIGEGHLFGVTGEGFLINLPKGTTVIRNPIVDDTASIVDIEKLTASTFFCDPKRKIALEYVGGEDAIVFEGVEVVNFYDAERVLVTLLDTEKSPQLIVEHLGMLKDRHFLVEMRDEINSILGEIHEPV